MIVFTEKSITNETEFLSAIYFQLAVMGLDNVELTSTEVTFQKDGEDFTLYFEESGELLIEGSEGYQGTVFEPDQGQDYARISFFRDGDELVFWVSNQDFDGDYGALRFSPDIISRSDLSGIAPDASYMGVSSHYQNFFWLNESIPYKGSQITSTLNNLRLGHTSLASRSEVKMGTSTWKLFHKTPQNSLAYVFRIKNG